MALSHTQLLRAAYRSTVGLKGAGQELGHAHYSINEGAFLSLNVKSAGKMNCGRVKYAWEFILTLCLSELRML